MKRSLISACITCAILVGAQSALADPTCTTEPKTAWQNADAFQKQLTDKGYVTTHPSAITEQNLAALH